MRNRSGKEMCEHGESGQDTSDKRDTGHWKEVSDSRTLADILKSIRSQVNTLMAEEDI